jgi:hypothetical protein
MRCLLELVAGVGVANRQSKKGKATGHKNDVQHASAPLQTQNGAATLDASVANAALKPVNFSLRLSGPHQLRSSPYFFEMEDGGADIGIL